MKEVVLPNGLKVLFVPKKSNSVVVQVMIKVGSNDELPHERGISHFLEHILFEGTKKRPNSLIISNEVERIGGNFNAYTTNERTCFYVKVLTKHFDIALDVLLDILQNSLFDKDHIKREKNIVLKEIEMVNDEPSFYQWVLLQKKIYKKHLSRFPTYGDPKVVKNLTRQKIVDFYEKYYVPNNMTLLIVGDVKNWKKKVENLFVLKKKNFKRRSKVAEPVQKRSQVFKEKRDLINNRTIIAFKSVDRKHKDSFVLDVINSILGRGQSGRMFSEIRTKRGLAYEVSTQYICDKSYGYFAVYASVDKKNTKTVLKVALEEIQKLKKTSKKDLDEAINFIEGCYLMEVEDNQKMADQLLMWDHVCGVDGFNDYIKKIKKVSVSDVKRVISKYFNHHTMVVLEGK
jgi:predicted Zn-dependent peptidase